MRYVVALICLTLVAVIVWPMIAIGFKGGKKAMKKTMDYVNEDDKER